MIVTNEQYRITVRINRCLHILPRGIYFVRFAHCIANNGLRAEQLLDYITSAGNSETTIGK